MRGGGRRDARLHRAGDETREPVKACQKTSRCENTAAVRVESGVEREIVKTETGLAQQQNIVARVAE